MDKLLLSTGIIKYLHTLLIPKRNEMQQPKAGKGKREKRKFTTIRYKIKQLSIYMDINYYYICPSTWNRRKHGNNREKSKRGWGQRGVTHGASTETKIDYIPSSALASGLSRLTGGFGMMASSFGSVSTGRRWVVEVIGDGAGNGKVRQKQKQRRSIN